MTQLVIEGDGAAFGGRARGGLLGQRVQAVAKQESLQPLLLGAHADTRNMRGLFDSQTLDHVAINKQHSTEDPIGHV